MRLEWLEDILAVVKTGSFAQAAHQRNLTASAFSRRIQGIEEHLGMILFDRSRKPVQLMAGVAQRQDQMARLAAELRELTSALRRGENANRMVLASQHALTAALTPAMVARIHTAHPDVYLRLMSANLDECFAHLLARQADVAMVYRVAGRPHAMNADYIETVCIGTDRLIAVFATRHIAQVMHELQSEGDLRVIAYPRDVFFGEAVEEGVYASIARYRIVRVAETALTLAAQELALAGLGVAWLPQSLVQRMLTDGRLTDLSDHLPAVALEVTAVRLAAVRQPIEDAIWAVLTQQ